jgi:S1-C subfamily serine protease
VELDRPDWVWGGQPEQPAPPRRRSSRAIVAALIAVAVAAVVIAGLTLTKSHAHRVGAGTVIIETNLAYQGAQAAGTGMVLTPSGEVLTNNHVIRGATDIRIRVPGTSRSYAAHVIGYDVSDDVAVLQASGASELQTASLGDSSSVSEGQSVRALGNAGGTGRLTPAPGTVTGVGRSITVSDDQGGSESLSGLIETNAPIRPGDSGGPLFNASGDVIGMDTAASVSNDVAQTTASQGYAIPINKAIAIVQQIESGNGSDTIHVGGTAFLGVEASADQYDGQGAVISSVVPGSAAEAAGLAAGDEIVAVGGQTISSPDDLGTIVSSQKPGDSIDATYVAQDGSTQTANVTLASGPPR